MKLLEVNRPTRALLSEVRQGKVELMLDDVDPDLAEMAVIELGMPKVMQAGVSRVTSLQYRWFLKELARLLKHKLGWDLGFELEALLRKWTGYALDPVLLQRQLRTCILGLVHKPAIETEADKWAGRLTPGLAQANTRTRTMSCAVSLPSSSATRTSGPST